MSNFNGWAASDFAEKGVNAIGRKLFADVDLRNCGLTWREADKAYKMGWEITDYASGEIRFTVSIRTPGLIRCAKTGEAVGFIQDPAIVDIMRSRISG